MICSTGATTTSTASPPLVDTAGKGGNNKVSPARGEKQPYNSDPLSSVVPTPTSPGECGKGMLFIINYYTCNKLNGKNPTNILLLILPHA
jgi:hypothetical protein